MVKIKSTGKKRVKALVSTLNKYKDRVELDIIFEKGSELLWRQKGQLKIENTILEEFLIHLISPKTISSLSGTSLSYGPQTAFMSLAFYPTGIKKFDSIPEVILKEKDQDFVVGKQIYYKLSTNPKFEHEFTKTGNTVIAVIATECKTNLDKTMFQEACGTASRLKMGVPVAKYYVLVEYVDMTPEDCRLTDIDNVFAIRHAKRLPQDKRRDKESIRELREKHPIDWKVLWNYTQEIATFFESRWYDPNEALKRGSFTYDLERNINEN
ncbi:MAG: Bpu10I family restriction endonuclease [Candidatus Thorarchaeota archaeon]|nr:Bpu10I family restriction endonuclease [Candidatus Thorarchaeota archaeon]